MYAVIEAGGKQYRVELGSELEIDRLEVEPGSSIELGRVLLVADGDDAQVGLPVVDGARVTADVLRQDRGEKIDVFKYRPKARRRVKKGHRAELTVVRVSDIVLNGRSAAEAAQADAKKAESERAAAEKAAADKAAADRALADKLAADEQEAQQATEDTQPAAKATSKATTKSTTKSTTESTAKASGADSSASSASTSKKTSTAPKGASRTKKKDE